MGCICSGSCELPSLPLPPFLPCGLRADPVHVQVAGFDWLGRVHCSRQISSLFSKEKSSRLNCSEYCLDPGFQTFPSHPAATKVMADSLALAYYQSLGLTVNVRGTTCSGCGILIMCNMPIFLFFLFLKAQLVLHCFLSNTG